MRVFLPPDAMSEPEARASAQPAARLLDVSASQRHRESRHAQAREMQEAAWCKSVRHMLLQCVLLMFLGTPLYALAWHLTDPAQAHIVVAAAFVLSYVAPLARMLVFHVRATSRGDY